MLVPTVDGLGLCSDGICGCTVGLSAEQGAPTARRDGTQRSRTMSDISNSESAQATREAQDAIVSRPRGSKSGAIAEAMRRYLSSETYDQLRKRDRERADEKSRRDGE